MTAWCPTVEEMINKLQGTDDTVKLIGHYGNSNELAMDKEGQRLIEVIRECKRPVPKDCDGLSLSFLYVKEKEWNTPFFREFEESLYDAWKSNKHITRMLMEMERDVSLDEYENHGQLLAKGFEECQHVTGLGNRFATKSFILRACEAAVMKEHIETFEVTTELQKRKFDDETVQALAMVKMKFPDALVGGSRCLNSQVASKAIVNPRAEIALRSHQRNIMNAEEFENVKNMLPAHEKHRLMMLLPLICEKYCLIGGLELLNLLPSDFEIAAPPKDLAVGTKGEYPQGLSELDYKKETLKSIRNSMALKGICKQVQKELNALGEAGEKNPELVPKIVDKFFQKNGIADLPCWLDAYAITVDHGDNKSKRAVPGNYKQCGFCNGFPCFKHEEEENPPVYLYYFSSNGIASWSFSDVLSGNISNTNLPDETSGPNVGKRPLPHISAGDLEKWQTFNGCKTPTLKPYKYKKRVQDSVSEFLQHNRYAQSQHLSLRNQMADLRQVGGSTKGFEGTAQKGENWLRELNRSTFVFDSPALLVVGFKLLEKKVETLGGELVGLTNHFLKDGTLDVEPEGPPCLNLKFRIQDYTYEVIMTLGDFAKATPPLAAL